MTDKGFPSDRHKTDHSWFFPFIINLFGTRNGIVQTFAVRISYTKKKLAPIFYTLPIQFRTETSPNLLTNIIFKNTRYV